MQYSKGFACRIRKEWGHLPSPFIFRLLNVLTSTEVKTLRLVSHEFKQAVDASLHSLRPRHLSFEQVGHCSTAM